MAARLLKDTKGHKLYFDHLNKATPKTNVQCKVTVLLYSKIGASIKMYVIQVYVMFTNDLICAHTKKLLILITSSLG